VGGRRGAMEEGECAQHAAALGIETLNLDGDDIEMADEDSDGEETHSAAAGRIGGAGGGGSGGQLEKGVQEGKNKKKKRGKGKKRNKGRQDAPNNIGDINR
jgi:phosphorylated adapter RNA export protein